MDVLKILVLLFSAILLKLKLGCCNVYMISSQSNQCSEGILDCHSLSFYIQNVSQYFTSNTEFKFLSGIHILSNTPVPVNVSGINNITFTGQSAIDTPIIQCTNESHGFVFWNTSNIILKSLIVEGCSPTIYDSPLTVTNCNALTLRDFTIRNTTGVGLMIHNVNTLNIAHSNFSKNGLGISTCSLKTHQWWYSVNVIATDVAEVNYTITDTVFNGNIASSGQLGGGLHCHIINTQSAVVALKNSMFRGINGCLSGGANITVDGYSMLANVIVNDSTFIDHYRTDIPYYQTHTELDGGALKIKTKQVQSYITEHTSFSIVVIGNSTFINNTARYCAGAAVLTFWSSNNHIHIINNTFIGNEMLINDSNGCKGRVGGLCIRPAVSPSVSNITVDVTDSKFVSNVGQDGAALQIWPYLENSNTNCNIAIKNSIFHSNKVPNLCNIITVIVFRWDYSLSTTGNVSITVNNCSVVGNNAGSALLVDIPTTDTLINKYFFNVYFTMAQCVFQANYMGLRITTGSGIQYYITIQSSKFSEHLVPASYYQLYYEVGAIVVIGYSHLTIVNIANVLLNNNKISPIFIDNCGLRFSGYNVIENNATPQDGGGIHFSIGYAFLSQNATLIFRNNTARRGGALYSQTQTFIQTASMCTFLGLRTALFYNNSASIAGNNMYGGFFSACYYHDRQHYRSTATHNYMYLNHDCYYLSSPDGLFQFPPETISSDPFGVLLCNDEHKVLPDKRNVTASIYPGQYVQLTVTTVGYCGGFSPGFLNVSTLTEGVQIMENAIQGQKIDHPCGNLSFKPLISQTNTTIIMEIDVAQSIFPLTLPLKVIVNISSCPHGMFLKSTTRVCQCDSTISDYVQQCNISHAPNPFKKNINNNNWITYNNEKQCINIAPICPFDYCSLHTNIYFNLDNTTDYQCSNNRTGILCGQCQSGLSLMLGSNRCQHCSNRYLLLLIVFFVAGIVLIFLILLLNLTVSVGMLNGLLFYANIVKLNETQLFPNGSIPVVSQFISWINLDFGVELCFFNGLDGYWKTWLQFVFPLYVWLVTIVIIFYSKYSIKFSRYLPTNIISVLATLILISFTKLLRTVTGVFMATRLHCDTHTELLWSVDGSIEYWSIKHSLLMGFAAIVLMFVIVYTFMLLFSQCLQRASNYQICCCLQHVFLRIHPFIDAYTGPFVPNYGYWTGVLVLFRIIVTVVFTYTSGSVDYINNYVIVLLEIAILNVFHSGFHQSKLNYYCEKFFHVNLCVLCVINGLGLDHFNISYVAIATMTSVTLSLLAFIAIVSWQVCKILSGKFKCTKRNKEVQPLLQQEVDEDKSRYSPSMTVRRRDSIIFDFN